MLTTLLALALYPLSGTCSQFLIEMGQCNNDGSTISIGFEDTYDGSEGNDGGWGAIGYGNDWGWWNDYPTGNGYVRDPHAIIGEQHRCAILGPTGPGCTPADIDDDASDDFTWAPIPAFDPITISDVAQFVPIPPQIEVDPEGVAVMNLPANFVAAADEQILTAEILGRPVTVRFTPVQFAFDTGDGGVVTAQHGGVPWEASGSAQFTPTDTSHVYSARGVVYPSVTVTYAASVDLGTGWIALGTVDASGPTRELRVYEAVTRLVVNS